MTGHAAASPQEKGARFREEIAKLHGALRASLARSDDLGPVARDAQMALIRALVDFGQQAEGTKGQAWAILVERAARQLEHAQGLADEAERRKLVADVDILLATAIGDMNNP